MENPEWTDYTTLLEGRPNCWCANSFTCFRAERKKKKKRTILNIKLCPSIIIHHLYDQCFSGPHCPVHLFTHTHEKVIRECLQCPPAAENPQSAHLQTCSGVSLCRPSNSVGFKAVWVPTTMLYLVSKETFSNLGAPPSVRSLGKKKNVAGIGIKD